jgi:hypothetical protein
MTKTLALAVMVAVASMAEAGSDDSRRAAREQAPRLMKDAVAAGTIDAADFAAIADWILHEKEEKVAAGLIEVIGAAEPAVAGAGGQRWEPTTRAVFSLFATVLRDAQGNHRRSGRDIEPEIAALVSAAAPAVAATLQEVDPESKARITALLHALGPLTHDLAPLIGADVLGAAREALGEAQRP